MDLLTVLCGDIFYLRSGLAHSLYGFEYYNGVFWKRCGKSEKDD